MRFLRAGVAAVAALRREEARVVDDPLVVQDVERPLAAGGNRKAGGAKPEYPAAALLFEHVDGFAEVLAELVRRQLVHPPVPERVRRQLMPARRDGPGDL